VLRSKNPEFNNAVMRINIYRDHRQTIQYIRPQDYMRVSQAELVVIDEAAAIPITHVRKLLGPYLVIISSTVHGYEGTGRSLSLKLISSLKRQGQQGRNQDDSDFGAGRQLKEI
jgi:N-acetyltransferase 10